MKVWSFHAHIVDPHSLRKETFRRTWKQFMKAKSFYAHTVDPNFQEMHKLHILPQMAILMSSWIQTGVDSLVGENIYDVNYDKDPNLIGYSHNCYHENLAWNKNDHKDIEDSSYLF